MLRYLLLLGLLSIASTYAVRNGGRPEKQVAAILSAMVALDLGYHGIVGWQTSYDGIDPFHTFNDAWALAAMLAVALTADRFWTLWLTALQVIAATSHLLRVIDSEMLRIVYAVITRFPFWLQILLLIGGTWNHARKRRPRAGPTS